MNNTTRIIVSMVCAAALAALATPELGKYLPPHIGQILAIAITAGIARMEAVGKNQSELPKTESRTNNGEEAE